jgi:hypothetical protein
LDDHTGVIADLFTDATDLRGIDACLQLKNRVAGLERHHHLFHRSVAGAFTDTVYGYFRLPRACLNTRQRIGCCQTKIVVRVHRNGHVFNSRHIFHDARDQRTELVGRGVSHRIGDIERRRACLYGFCQHNI